MKADPRILLADSPMRPMQIVIVALCVLLNALDGFDVLAISFASPGIAAEWQIDRAALGLVLAMELIGMAAGSVVLGTVADRFGRRPTLIVCLLAMASGMALAATAQSVAALSAYRFFTGLGIGGMLACVNALAAEFANRRARSLAVVIMAAGYPAGAVVGGMIASHLLAAGGWRDVFVFGAAATLFFLPLVWFLLPESVGYLMQRRPGDALARINAILRRLGHATLGALTDPTGHRSDAGLGALFRKPLLATTLLLTAAYFAHIMTFYFILKWIPKLVVDMGYPAASAGGVLVWANVGGLCGALLLGLLSLRIGIRPLVMAAMLLSAVTVALFGQGQGDLATLSLKAAMAGFCTNAGVVGLYAIIAQSFPTAVRAGGTGVVIGAGRGGAALGPVAGGLLFSFGWGLPLVAALMAAGSLLAVLALVVLRGAPRDIAAPIAA